MDPLTLGLSLAVVGIGGTLVTLYLFSLIASLLMRLFPLKRPQEADEAESSTPNPQPPTPR